MGAQEEIPETMTAATIVAFNEPLEIRHDVKVPDVPDDRLLIKIEAASLCSSDLMAHKGYMPYMTSLPYCGGHEPVGTVAKVGSAVKGFKVGDRVGFLMYDDFCGECDECQKGLHRYCASRTILGFSRSYGGFSEYSLSHPASTVKIPEAVSFDIAAPLFCAGITAYSALLKVKSKPGQLVNIVGCGGVGHIAIMFAKAMGYRVNAYDIAESKLELAKKSGADEAFDSRSTPTPEKALSTIVITGADAAYQGAFGMTANHGAVIAVGLPSSDLKINLPLWASKNICLLPCNTGSREDMIGCLDLVARNNIEPLIEVRHIDDINQGYKDIAEGKVDGRIVYHFK